MQKAINILLVEDNDIDAEAIRRSLLLVCSECTLRRESTCSGCIAAGGYELIRKATIEDGVGTLSRAPFDILLLDLGLPGVSGLTALTHFRSRFPMLPIVVLTGGMEKGLAFEAIRDGAQDFLIKGEYTSRELQRCIHYSMERFQLKLELEKTALELARQSSILKSVFNNMGDGVVVINGSGKPTLLNPAAKELLDVSWMEEAPEQWPGVQELLGQAKNNKEVTINNELVNTLQQQIHSQEEIFLQSKRHPEGKYISVTKRTIDEGSAIDGCVAVLHDITKRRRIERLKDEFVSVVSHELRTPLTSISGSLSLALGGVTGNMSDGVREMLLLAERNSNRLLGLINDLLDVQKYESGNLELLLAPVDLVKLIVLSIENNEGYARKFNVSVKGVFDVKQEACTVFGDENRLGQVMANLLSNAIKYSPENELVLVQVILMDEDVIKVSIIDKGPGIPEEHRSTIFDKFSQVDSSTARHKAGTGLGLSISKSIIEMHGGEIDFVCPEGGGTIFHFTLPLHLPVAEDRAE